MFVKSATQIDKSTTLFVKSATRIYPFTSSISSCASGTDLCTLLDVADNAEANTRQAADLTDSCLVDNNNIERVRASSR